MEFMQLLLLSFALSMDSAALNMANGARYKSLGFGKILFIAFMLGFFSVSHAASWLFSRH